jgi:hypothetical protein
LPRTHIDLDEEENMAMKHESYKAWLDAMPIDDVRDSIERLEHKLSDLRVVERLHAERQPGDEAASETADGEASSEEETPSEPHSGWNPSQPGPDEPT